MNKIDSKIYSKHYYKRHEEGFVRMLERLSPYISTFSKDSKILDIGCGSGELAVYLVKKGHSVVGVDYSSDAISLAKKRKEQLKGSLRQKLRFVKSDVTKIKFSENEFDYAISIDLFEHLYNEQLIFLLKKIKICLKPNGKLLVHTEPNKFYLNFTHKFYIYPVSEMLIRLNKKFTGNDYPGLPKDPRSQDHKEQHVNEPTYIYLRDLFKKCNFSGNIKSIGLHKPIISWKDRLYNYIVLFGPLSKIAPLKYLFEYEYICYMENKK